MARVSETEAFAFCEFTGQRVPMSVADCVTLLYLGTSPDQSDLSEDECSKLYDLGLAACENGHIIYTQRGREMAEKVVSIGDGSVTRH